MRTVAAKPEHAAAIIPRLRIQDAVRLYAMTDGNSADALKAATDRSVITWCGLDDDAQPVTLGGVIPTSDDAGYLWQVTAADLAAHKRDYIKQGRQMMAVILKRFRRLETRVAADYPQALRHLRRLGWEVSPVDEMTPIPSHLCIRIR